MYRPPPRINRPDTLLPYPTLFRSPDSDAGPAGVRVRRLIRVRPSGKVLGPSPTSGTHSSGAAIGASNRPAKPPKWQAAQASTIGNGLDTRAASAGIVSALTRDRKSTRLNSSH